jgi:hypothetical protein
VGWWIAHQVFGYLASFRSLCAFNFCDTLCRWLGLTAFLRVLQRKQTRYTTLLAQLQELVDAPALRSAARQLAPVVDPARNSVFDAILY